MTRADAVVVGGGHNGLAAAVILAKAGWKVVVVERNPEAGGAVRTAEVTLPGFRHDLFATNLNLFAGSPFFAEYGDELADHGFEIAASARPFSSAFPDGGFVGVSTDQEETLASIGRLSGADARSFSALAEQFALVSPHMFPLLGVPMPSMAAVRALAAGGRALGRQWPLEVIRLVLQSPREWAEEHFDSREVQALCASWGMHLDFAPDVSGGALFPFLETFASAANGMALGAGGARAMIDALEGLLAAEGGELRTSSPVERVQVRGGRAVGVVLGGGEELAADRAVIANLNPRVLFDGLVGGGDVPAGFRRRAQAFRFGPGTMMVHLALQALPPWRAPEAVGYSYVHVGPYMEDMSLAYHQAQAGLLPRRPTLVVGQPTVVDPTRAPEGKHVLWVQVRVVPGEIRGDAAGEIEGRDWDEVKEAYADRVMAILEEHAPGVGNLVLGRHVLSPLDLERYNPNLVGGDSLGGSHHLMQNFFLRPFPGWSRYATPIEALYMCGSGTWPGAGVGAGSGYLLGKHLTSPVRRRPFFRRGTG